MSGGALRIKRSSPGSTTARSSSWPSTGTKSGIRSMGKKRYAPIPARMSFCCAGTRLSRSSAHTKRMYVGNRRMRSTTSAMSFGARMRLANTHVPLRETCPKRADRLSQRRFSIRGPERDQVLRLTVRNATKLDRRRGLGRDPVSLGESRANVLGGDRLLVSRQNKNCGGPPRRKAGQVDDRRRHERPVRNDDLTAVVGPELCRAERDSYHRACVAGDLDAVADPEGTLDKDPDAGEEVLEDVLGG